MNFETVDRCGRMHVIKNGVESAAFVEKRGGNWYLYDFVIAAVVPSEDEGITRITNAMGDWHTITQAAERLVDLSAGAQAGMGAFDTAPSAQMMGIWCREGKFPGAMKILGRGTKARGGGGSWRIPESALPGFVEWRKGK